MTNDTTTITDGQSSPRSPDVGEQKRERALRHRGADIVEFIAHIDAFARQVQPATWDDFERSALTLMDGYLRSDAE